jgi:hypothetical protein
MPVNDDYGDQRDEWEELAEQIQVDVSEGAEALKRAVRKAGGSSHQVVLETLAGLQDAQDNQRALNTFVDRYPTVAQDEDFAEVGMKQLRRELYDDLHGAGFSDDELGSMQGNTQALLTAHNTARRKGLQVRDREAILDAVGGHLEDKFNVRPANGPAYEPRRSAHAARARFLDQRRAFVRRRLLHQGPRPRGAPDLRRAAGAGAPGGRCHQAQRAGEREPARARKCQATLQAGGGGHHPRQ